MRKTLIAASLTTVFLLALLAPVAFAGEGAEGKDVRRECKEQIREDKKEYKQDVRAAKGEYKQDRRDAVNESKEQRAEAKQEYKQERRDAKIEYKQERSDSQAVCKELRRDAKGPRGVPGNVTLDLDGLAVTRDNLTYTFELAAEGKGLQQLKVDKEGETRLRLVARLAAHVVVTDSNNTVVKEGDLRVKLYVRGHGDELHWTLVSVAKRDSGMPRLVLHGEAVADDDGGYGLTGSGRAVFKAGDEKPAIPVRLRAEGGFTFEPLAPPAPVEAASASPTVTPAATSTAPAAGA